MDIITAFIKFVVKTSIVLWIILSIILWFALGGILKESSSPLDPKAEYSEILADPQKFAVKIDSIPCVESSQQCLVINGLTNKKATPEYGEKVRQELYKRGINLLPYGKSASFLVMLHGKGSRKEELLPAALRYVAGGFTVILLDLPEHGENTASGSWGADDFDAELVATAFDDVRRETGRLSDAGYLWSISLGGAYANRTVLQYPDLFKAMVVISSFSSLESLLSSHIDFMPTPLRAAVMKEANFFAGLRGIPLAKSTPGEWAQNIDIPVMVIHGKEDAIIPFAEGERLFDSYKSQDKEFIAMPKTGHNTVFIKKRPIYADTIEFLLKK